MRRHNFKFILPRTGDMTSAILKLDGKHLYGVTRVEFNADPHESPELRLTLIPGAVELNGLGDINVEEQDGQSAGPDSAIDRGVDATQAGD